jgi:hypothetical protein
MVDYTSGKTNDEITGKDVDEAISRISEADRKELSEVAEELAQMTKGKWPDDPITNESIKKRAAKIFLKIIKNTPEDRKAIMESCYVVTASFNDYIFGDDLDEAIKIADDLEVPQKYVYDNVFVMFGKLRIILERYIGGG